ncbi:MAG: hypothetical protein JW776_08040 [Candidatus Lokiarchaeota archaeon]|nr:hypothetical protein [Candidatus Lokiarchaeota archaeon]
MQTTKYEHVIFYLDVTGSHVKRKDVTKAVIQFIKEKSHLNPLTKYGLMYFKAGGYPEYIDEDDSDLIVKKINDDWKDKESAENFLENGLFYCLSVVAQKSTERAGEFRVIVITDKPSNKPAEYQEALFNLVDTVCFFPTYIDIIRVGSQRFYSDDVKLRIVTSTTNGGLFYVSESKHLTQILQGLTKSKRFTALNQPEKIVIDEDNKEFYENLATDLLTPTPHEELGLCAFCNSEICDSGIYTRILKCYNCGSSFHEYHIGKYAFDHNIGLPHIFRCPQCDVLLKMDEHAVLVINDILIEQETGDFMDDEKFQGEYYNTEASEIEMEVNMESVLEQENLNDEYFEITEQELQNPSNKNGQTIPLRPSGFGFFQKPLVNLNGVKNPEYEVPASIDSSTPVNETFETQKTVTSPNSRSKRSSNTRKFLVCKICGTSNNIYNKKCKNCGVDL